MLLPSFIFVTAWFLALPCLANFTEDVTHELHGRGVRIPGTSGPGGVGGIEDLFKIHSDCNQHIDTLNAWIHEASTLHYGLEHAMYHANTGGLLAYVAHFMFFFGLKWDFPGRKWRNERENNENVKAVKDHIGRVTQFLNGGGLVNPQVSGQKPWLFCSATAFERQEPGRAARDGDGKDVVMDHDDTTGLPNYLTVEAAFAMQRNRGYNPYWVPAFNGYDFIFADTICGPPDLENKQTLALTSAPLSREHLKYYLIDGEEPVEYDMGKSNRHIILCPALFESKATGKHSVASLSETVGRLYPPVMDPNAPDHTVALDRMMTRGATLYHELFHLTDNDDTLPHIRGEDIVYKEDYGLVSINNAVLVDEKANPKDEAERAFHRSKLVHNPESYAFLAQALHMYRKPPTGKTRVIYNPTHPVDARTWGHNENDWRNVKDL